MAVERWTSNDGVDSFKLSDSDEYLDYIQMTVRYHHRSLLRKDRVDQLMGTVCILSKEKRSRQLLFYLPILPVIHLFAGGLHFIEIIPIPRDQHEEIVDRWREGCLGTLSYFYDHPSRHRRPYKKLVMQLMTAYLLGDPLQKDLEPLVANYTHGKFMGRRLETFLRNMLQGIEMHKILTHQYSEAAEAGERVCSIVPYLSNKEQEIEVRPYRNRLGFVQWKVIGVHMDESERVIRIGFNEKGNAEDYVDHIKEVYRRGIIKPPKGR